MRVTLSHQKLSGGVKSLFLDYYHNGKRHREYLKIYLRPKDKVANDNNLRTAEAARALKEHELTSSDYGLVPAHRKKQPILKWIKKYADDNDKKKWPIYAIVHDA